MMMMMIMLMLIIIIIIIMVIIIIILIILGLGVSYVQIRSQNYPCCRMCVIRRYYSDDICVSVVLGCPTLSLCGGPVSRLHGAAFLQPG